MHACVDRRLDANHTSLLLRGVWLIMAKSMLDQSSQEILNKLDEQLKECTPLEECPGEQGHGVDYAVRLEEIRKVGRYLNSHPEHVSHPTNLHTRIPL